MLVIEMGILLLMLPILLPEWAAIYMVVMTVFVFNYVKLPNPIVSLVVFCHTGLFLCLAGMWLLDIQVLLQHLFSLRFFLFLFSFIATCTTTIKTATMTGKLL